MTEIKSVQEQPRVNPDYAIFRVVLAGSAEVQDVWVEASRLEVKGFDLEKYLADHFTAAGRTAHPQ